MKHFDFCTNCRKETEYNLYKSEVTEIIRDIEYNFQITSAKCNECHRDIFIPGLIDLNSKEIDKQYRIKEGIVTIDEIEKLKKIKNMENEQLSLHLGFEKNTITQYLLGQVPSKEHSDIIYSELTSSDIVEKIV